MNDLQKRILIGAIVAVVLTMLFPPFHIALRPGIVTNMGYGFLFSPPQRSAGYAGSVTVELLLLEWLGILLVAGGLFWLARDHKQAAAGDSKLPNPIVRWLVTVGCILVAIVGWMLANGLGKELSRSLTATHQEPRTWDEFVRDQPKDRSDK